MFNFKKIIAEFKEFNAEFLFKMIEQMNISGLINDVRISEALRNIRIEDFITLDMVKTLLHPALKEHLNEEIIKAKLVDLFRRFYSNLPLPFYISPTDGRTTGAPHIISMLAELLDIEPKDKILILGSKCGYMEAIIHDIDLDLKVDIIEKVHEIYMITKSNLERIKLSEDIKIYEGDPILSLDEFPSKEYNKILFTGYVEKFPYQLLEKIKIGGIICAIIGIRNHQILKRLFKTSEETFDEENHSNVLFSPLITDFNKI